MEGLRAVFLGEAGSLEAVRSSFGAARPASLRAMAADFSSPVRFEGRIITAEGVAITGGYALELFRDGRLMFTGYTRATGWSTYGVSLALTVSYRPDPGAERDSVLVLVLAEGGTAYGTNRAGDRTYDWRREERVPLVSAHWSAFRRARVAPRFEYRTDHFGVIGDATALVAQLALMNATFGATGAGLVVAGRAASALDLEQFLLPGVVGVIVAAGAVFILGPGAAYPVFAAGAGAAAVVKGRLPRHLHPHERTAVHDVFGWGSGGQGNLDLDNVLLTPFLGVGSRPFVVPVPGGPIYVNIGEAYDDPLGYEGKGPESSKDLRKRRDEADLFRSGHPGVAVPRELLPPRRAGQLLMHEMTHVWQIQKTSFTPALFCRLWGTALTTLDEESQQRAYSTGAPGRPFSDYGPEAQGSIVDGWYAGADGFAARSEESPWFPYIAGPIRQGVG